MSPANNATDVAVTTPVDLTFNEILDPSTVRSDTVAVSIDGFSGQVAGSVAVSGAVVTFTPALPLPGNAPVRVQVNALSPVRDLAGNVSTFFESVFTTVAGTDTTPPSVMLVTPADDNTGVGPNAAVVLTFSEEALNPTTITSDTFVLFANGLELMSSVSRSADNRTVTLRAPLPPASLITAVATSDVQDLAGNRLANFTGAFTTAPPVDAMVPQVVSQRPGNGAMGVPLDTSIVLYISEPLDSATVAGALLVAQNGVVVPGSTTVSSQGRAVEFVPTTPWALDALIEVFLGSSARDLAGNPLQSYRGSFRTVPDPRVTAPAVVRSSPAPGASEVPLNVVLEVEFNTSLDPATVNANTVSLRRGAAVVPSTVNLVQGGRVVRITLTTPLPANTSHTVLITTGLRDLDGQAPTGNFSQFFTTGASTDTIAPQVIAVGPPDGAIEVGVNASVRVQFSEPINPLTVTGTTVLLSGGSVAVVPSAINFMNNNQDVELVPHAPLPAATTMTLIVSGVRDLAGNTVLPHTTMFTTDTGPDTDPPVVVRTNPFGGALNVPTTVAVSVEFNESIDPSSVTTSSFTVHDNVLDLDVPGSVSVSPNGRLVSFVPGAPLGTGRGHTVSLTGLRDLTGNSVDFSFSFTTAFAGDTVAPRALGMSPPDGASAVPINAQVVVAFDEPIQTRSADQVTLQAGGSSLPVLRSLTDGNQRVILRPVMLLAPNTPFTVHVGGVQDLAGNTLTTGSSTFTTGTEAALLTPTVTIVTPLDRATRVSINTTIKVAFSDAVNPLTVTASTFIVRTLSGEQVPGSITVAADEASAIFTPASALALATTYQVQVSGVTDLAGQAVSFLQTTFTTAAN